MKRLLQWVLAIGCFFTTSLVYAAGGSGANCNPSTGTWGSCSLESVPFQEEVTKTVDIPGGNYASPFVANQDNTHYILQGDIIADATAIVVAANHVIIDLNGFTITYNQLSPGEGVTLAEVYNKHHVSIRNGSIIQGTALSEGDQFGSFNNPVSTCNSVNGNCRSTSYSQVANLYIRYGGRDISGVKWTGSEVRVEQCTIEDTYEFGTLKNRDQGVSGIAADSRALIRNNSLVNVRHRGISVGNNSLVHDNHIQTRTLATNGYGISGYKNVGSTVHSNTIIARGEHPIGIGFVSNGTSNIKIYNNYIDSKTTRLGDEYSGSYLANPEAVITGNFAVGFRTTWGADNLEVYDNEIHVYSDSRYVGTYSPTGETAYIRAGARGIMAGLLAGQTAIFRNNAIYALDRDGEGKAYGIACNYNFSDKLFFLGNTVTSNIANIAIGDEYGKCENYPLFQENVFIKADNFFSYATLTTQFGGYNNAEARLVDNVYQGGGSVNSVKFHPSGAGRVEVYFGSVATDEYLFNYRLHDESGTSSTLLREDYNPPISLPYGIPGITPLAPLAPGKLRISKK